VLQERGPSIIVIVSPEILIRVLSSVRLTASTVLLRRQHFIFLIINDGSSDKSEDIILSYTDPRIKYIKNEENLGLTATLNKGVMLTATKYLARMDADDISLPERLKAQYDFMEANKDIGVCSTWYEMFGKENTKVKLTLNDEEIKATTVFGTAICHPTVILRTDLLKKNNINFGVPFEFLDGFGHKILEFEDVALWNKLKQITKFSIIKQVFLKYRWEGQNLTQQRLDIILERKKQYFKFISYLMK
jgi:glycosyltransferase involved in cell wall biosynthesis